MEMDFFQHARQEAISNVKSDEMKKTGILVAVGLVLIVGIAPLLFRGVDVLRPVLDAKGQQVRRADGRPQFQSDLFGQFMVNWDAYAVMAIGGLCILYGLGSTWHSRTRTYPNRGLKD